MKTSLLFLLALFLFAGSELIFSQNANRSQNKGGFVYLTAPNGTEKALSDTGDVDGDGISNELEVNGYTFSALGGLKPWNGDPNVKHYITDPLRWSTDGDPYSDYMEVTGINMPASISAPENDPLVAARPIISIKMTDYTVETLATISNSNGGHADSTFTNETSNSDQVGAEVTVEASLNPFELVGGSVTGSYSHTWTSTNSTTVNIGKDWNNTRTSQPDKAARLKLHIYMENLGGATALDVSPTVNLKLGDKTIATFIPSQKANTLTPPGTSDNRFPKNGTIVVQKDKNGDEITVTLNELKAIQGGAPLSLEVIQVDAKVVRWDPTTQNWDSDIDWASFESEINPVSVEVLAEMGNGQNYRYEVFAGTPYWDPQYKLSDILSLIFDKKEVNNVTYIENRKYPDDWYLSSPSSEVIDEWNNEGQPNNMLGLRMYRNTKLVMMSPGDDPAPIVNLASYSADYKNVFISAQPNNFPIQSVEAEVPINGKMVKYTLTQGDNSFYTSSVNFSETPDGPGTVKVTNARGDVTTSTIIIPAIYTSAKDVKTYSSFLPDPGGDFWIYQNGDTSKPMLLYCLFNDPETDAALEQPKEYLTVNNNGSVPKVFSDFLDNSDVYRATFNKIRINPHTLKMDINDLSFVDYENLTSGGGLPSWMEGEVGAYFQLGRVGWSYPGIDSVSSKVDLSGTPFNLAVDNAFEQGTYQFYVIDKSRKVMDIMMTNLIANTSTYLDFAGLDQNQDSLQLVYGYSPVPTRDKPADVTGNALDFSETSDDGQVSMGAPENLRVTGNFTLEAWIYPTGNGSNPIWGGIIINKEGEYELARNHKGVLIWAIKKESNSSWSWQSSNYYAPEKEWTHVALVYNQSQVKVYINGVLFHTAVSTGAVGDLTTAQNDFRIGGRQADDQFFKGVIDEVQVWNKARSADEIAKTYNDTLTTNYYASADSGLIGYWRFDKTTSLGDGVFTVKDFSINSNDGHLYGDVQLSAIPTDVKTEKQFSQLPNQYSLEQNYPNPFNPSTTIEFKLPETSHVTLKIYDITGREVASLVNEDKTAGNYKVNFNASNLASGVYFYRIQSGNYVKTNKMILMK